MTENVFVFSVKKYDFKNGDGKQLSGCTIHYLLTGDPTKQVDGDSSLGYMPSKGSFPVEVFERAKNVGIPCMAEIDFVMRQQQGDMVLKPENIRFK